MNSLGLIYKEFLIEGENFITVSHANNIYKDVRLALKPKLMNFKLKPNNKDGKGASAFISHLSRYRFQWLDFILPYYVPSPSDYPNETEMEYLNIVKDNGIGDAQYWRNAILEEIKGENFLLLGLELLTDDTKPKLSFISPRLPSRYWPCKFKLHECIITNAPICQYLRHRSSFLI